MRPFADPSEILGRTRIVDRFLGYVRLDTQSDEDSPSCPSTEKQLELGRRLVAELTELGLRGVGRPSPEMDDQGYVLAELPGTAPGRLGLCAHIDTAPQYTGTDVRPRVHEDYSGGMIDVGHGI